MAEHTHEHPHTHGSQHNERVLAWAFGAIAIFMGVEVLAGWLTNSLALLSDAGHMLSDAFSLGASWWAVRQGMRASNTHKTFGYGRFEVLAALVNGVLLMAVALWIVYEAIGRLASPPEVASRAMLLVATLGLLVNIGVAWWMMRGDTTHNLNMKSAYLHVLGDLLGSVAAMAAAGLMMWRGWYWADPVMSVLVALWVAKSGRNVAREALHILMEGAPNNVVLEDVVAALQQIEGVLAVHDVHIWSVSSDVHALSCHLVVSGEHTISQSQHILAKAAATLAQQGIHHSTIQLEDEAHGHDEAALCVLPSGSGHRHHH